MTKACDFVFWAGDLNFRVNMPHKDAVELCKEKKYDALLLHDEFLDADQKHSR